MSATKSVRVLEILLAIAGVALTGFLLFHLALFRFGMDQAIFAVVGDGLLHGELPYRDRWEIRTPGIYLLYAAGQLLFGKTMMAIRWLEVAALLSLFFAFPCYSRRFFGTAIPGFAGALLATLTHVQLEYWHTAQSETFGGVGLVWAVLLATWQPGGRRQLAAWVGAGALFTFAALLKPPLGGGFVLTLGLLVLGGWRARSGSRSTLADSSAFADWKSLLAPIVSFSLGGGLVVAGFLLPYVVTGSLTDLVWTYRDVIPEYVASEAGSVDFSARIYRAVKLVLFNYSPYLLPGLALWALLPPLGRREHQGVLYLLAAIAPQLIGVALQAKYYPYHCGGMVHLVALWSALGFFKLWQRLRRRPVWAVLLLVALGAVRDGALISGKTRPDFWQRCGPRWDALMNRDQRPRIEDQLHTVGPIQAAQIRQVSSWLRSNTAPDATVFVWGLQSAIYFEADRRPASRFITNYVLLLPWSAEQARKILQQEIEARSPAAIVVSRADRRPDLYGHQLDSAQSLKHYPWLAGLLAEHYQRVERFGNLIIYRRRVDEENFQL